MPDYPGMYRLLFNAVTDALDQLEQQNVGLAAQLLREAQQQTEELYLADEEQG